MSRDETADLLALCRAAVSGQLPALAPVSALLPSLRDGKGLDQALESADGAPAAMLSVLRQWAYDSGIEHVRPLVLSAGLDNRERPAAVAVRHLLDSKLVDRQVERHMISEPTGADIANITTPVGKRARDVRSPTPPRTWRAASTQAGKLGHAFGRGWPRLQPYLDTRTAQLYPIADRLRQAGGGR